MIEQHDNFVNVPEIPSRREFMRYVVAGSALSLSALSRLNASIYQKITVLNQKYIEDESPDGVYWNALRKHYLLEDGLIMMNCGTVGPMPKPVFNALISSMKRQCTNPFDVYRYFPRKWDEVRRKIAEFINASVDEIVITHNSTEGINFIANGLDLAKGDEVILSNMEHPGGTHPWNLKKERYGIEIKEVPIGLPPKSADELIKRFEEAITPRTKIISVSHLVYISGLVFPLKKLCRMAHERDILVLTDSAHGIGMLDLDMKEAGVDFFVTSPYKWLGSPTGIGVLYIRKEVQDRLWPTIATRGWNTYDNSRKFETLGRRSDPLTIALGEAIDFHNVIGKDRVERRIKTLAGYFKRELKKIPGIRLHTSEDPSLSAGLTAFSIEGIEVAKIVDYVREKYNIVIRTIGKKEKGTYGIRVSTNIFISLKEIDLLLEGIDHMVSHNA